MDVSRYDGHVFQRLRPSHKEDDGMVEGYKFKCYTTAQIVHLKIGPSLSEAIDSGIFLFYREGHSRKMLVRDRD
jgi:hypothetical protein